MKFQELYLELANSTGIIRTLLNGVTQKEAQLKSNKKTWSILEVTCHLYDEEREDFRRHLKFILDRDDDQWHVIDPQRWVTERRYNQQDFSRMKAKFFRERRNSLAWLKTLKNADWNYKFRNKWGFISAGEMYSSWVAHDNLHIRQLVELRRTLIEKKTRPFNIAYAGEW